MMTTYRQENTTNWVDEHYSQSLVYRELDWHRKNLPININTFDGCRSSRFALTASRDILGRGTVKYLDTFVIETKHKVHQIDKFVVMTMHYKKNGKYDTQRNYNGENYIVAILPFHTCQRLFQRIRTNSMDDVIDEVRDLANKLPVPKMKGEEIQILTSYGTWYLVATEEEYKISPTNTWYGAIGLSWTSKTFIDKGNHIMTRAVNKSTKES